MILSLRKFERRDMDELFSWFSTEREVLQWAGAALSWPLQKQEFRTLIRQHSARVPSREVWAVWAENRMLGHFQLSLNRRLRTAGLGRVALHPKLRGQRHGRPFMALVLQQAFSHEWVHRVDLLVYSHNAPAIRLYQNAGFTLEGTRRESTPVGEEVWDTHIMSVLRYEFDKRTERE